MARPFDGTTLEGYVDLLYRSPEGLVVVDYKTDQLGRRGPARRARRPVPAAAGCLRAGGAARHGRGRGPGDAGVLLRSGARRRNVRFLSWRRRWPRWSTGSSQRQPERPRSRSLEEHQHRQQPQRDQRRQREGPGHRPTLAGEPAEQPGVDLRPVEVAWCTPGRARCTGRRRAGRATGGPWTRAGSWPGPRPPPPRTGCPPSRSGCRRGTRRSPGWPGSSPWRIWATAKRAVVPAVPMTVPTKTTDSGSRSLHSGGFVVVVDRIEVVAPPTVVTTSSGGTVSSWASAGETSETVTASSAATPNAVPRRPATRGRSVLSGPRTSVRASGRRPASPRRRRPSRSSPSGPSPRPRGPAPA